MTTNTCRSFSVFTSIFKKSVSHIDKAKAEINDTRSVNTRI